MTRNLACEQRHGESQHDPEQLASESGVSNVTNAILGSIGCTNAIHRSAEEPLTSSRFKKAIRGFALTSLQREGQPRNASGRTNQALVLIGLVEEFESGQGCRARLRAAPPRRGEPPSV